MKQDPAYLLNRSRQFHKSYRRNRVFANVFVALWAVFFTGRFMAATVNRVGGLGWGFSTEDVWVSLAFVIGGGALWVFLTLIQAIILAYVRHTYGPEPTE